MRRRLHAALVRRRRAARDTGYVAIVVALFASTMFLSLSAIGVDISRIYLEGQLEQKAADAAALAGVTYLPTDLPDARAKAIAVAALNGYPNGGNITVTVGQGTTSTRLQVTITRKITNVFGQSFGRGTATVIRSSVAEYTGPAPVGNPCNTLGNEPPSQPLQSSQGTADTQVGQPVGSALPTSGKFDNCSSAPAYWTGIEGPETDKTQGDRFQTLQCGLDTNKTGGPTYACAGGKNSEYNPAGYYYTIHVDANAVGTPIQIQTYDPDFVFTAPDCSALVTPGADSLNPWTSTDGKSRYASAQNSYCTGDLFPGAANVAGKASTTNQNPVTTTFVLRSPTDTKDPSQAPVQAGCVKQYVGFGAPLTKAYKTATNVTVYNQAPTTDNLMSGTSTYNAQLSELFHEWVPLCTITPTVAGDYYLQVRTDVTAGGTSTANTNGFAPLIYSNNPAASAPTGNTTTGGGANAYAIRAVAGTDAQRLAISVSGYQNFPIRMNSTTSDANFYLIRALPGTHGQSISFEFYDAADNSAGYIQVLPPPASEGTNIPGKLQGCTYGLNDTAPPSYTAATNCSVPVQDTVTDGQDMHVIIPIPSSYSCNQNSLGGCWFRVVVHFNMGTVSDFETWDASVQGDPVRLVQ